MQSRSRQKLLLEQIRLQLKLTRRAGCSGKGELGDALARAAPSSSAGSRLLLCLRAPKSERWSESDYPHVRTRQSASRKEQRLSRLERRALAGRLCIFRFPGLPASWRALSTVVSSIWTPSADPQAFCDCSRLAKLAPDWASPSSTRKDWNRLALRIDTRGTSSSLID